MAKNIVILSDGTGQGASMPKAERTNVWKLWDATKKADPAQQVTFYDEGLGAEHKREWWRWAYDLASRATGLGISQNIKDCYTGNQRRHVQHAPHRSTATPDAAHSLELAAVKVVGRNPDQRRNLPAVHLSEFRQQGEERDGQHRAAAGFQSRGRFMTEPPSPPHNAWRHCAGAADSGVRPRGDAVHGDADAVRPGRSGGVDPHQNVKSGGDHDHSQNLCRASSRRFRLPAMLPRARCRSYRPRRDTLSNLLNCS